MLVVALPTALIPNPVFGREIPPTAWAWPVLLVTAALSGLLMATYVREDRAAAPVGAGDGRAGSAPDGAPETDEAIAQGRAGMLGGLLTFLAVGCPVCNKLALIALGYAGALQWFAPVQPFLAGGGVLLLGWALVRRLANDGLLPVAEHLGPGQGVDRRLSDARRVSGSPGESSPRSGPGRARRPRRRPRRCAPSARRGSGRPRRRRSR